MTKKTYVSMMNYWTLHPKQKKAVVFIAFLAPTLLFAGYPLFSLYLFLNHDPHLFLFLFIPAFDFLFVTVFRKILNLPRPYTLYDHPPITGKMTKSGVSCPSRHTASAVVIACACLWVSLPIGIFAACLALLVSVTRVLTGSHFPRDVVAGILISCIFSSIYLVV